MDSKSLQRGTLLFSENETIHSFEIQCTFFSRSSQEESMASIPLEVTFIDFQCRLILYPSFRHTMNMIQWKSAITTTLDLFIKSRYSKAFSYSHNNPVDEMKDIENLCLRHEAEFLPKNVLF